MRLENIVTSLDLSQKLKEIGIEQNSIFLWVKSNQNKWFGKNWQILEVNSFTFAEPYLHMGAFTAQELWDIIDGCFAIAVVNNKSTLGNPYSIIIEHAYIFHGKNIADCLAQLIIAQKEGENENS